MADSNIGSQESLPLSQESYRQLFSLVGVPLSNFMGDNAESSLMNDQAYDDLFSDISRRVPMIESNECDTSVPPPIPQEHEYVSRQLSSLPASENWPGAFSFTVSFNHQNATKSVSWLFSAERNKLYVIKDVPCPVNFATNTFMPDDVYIRAMALYSSSDHASDKVIRCVNHSMEDIKRKVYEAEHFVRCESSNSHYHQDPVTSRHSVTVPYENPPAGQGHSTYLFKFMCFGSCSGGPNRRAISIVFTLEQSGEVLGRQKIDLKVCACPMRDFKHENKLNESNDKKPLKRQSIDLLPVIKPPKKIKEENKEYCLKTRDKKCYKFLKKMQMIYSVYNAVKNQPNWKQLLSISSQSSSGEETEMDIDKSIN